MIAGHYRLVEHIGSGAMGTVWRAIDERLERSVAVKQILTQPGLSESERSVVRQRAMREAKNAARFQHPNAIVVFDIAEHDGDPCLVMEYLPSKSLSAILAERGTLPVGEIARIGEQVAAALVAAHRAGIVHRDVKPGNILIDDNGVCKIMDFGISRAAGDLTLTQTGLIGGTPAYLAPELARGADPKPASDVFSLGATLYHAIEGLPPYGDSTNQLALLYAAASGKLNPPTHAGPATALLMNLLRAEPEERPTMSEARDRLAALAAGESNGKALGATRVAPPIGMPQSGPQPAAVAAAAPVSPPWQRGQSPSGPPRNPTTAGTPVPPPRQPSGPNGARRKPLVFGALGVAVLVIAAVLTIVLTSNGDNGDTNAGGTSQSQNNPPPSESSPSAPESSGNASNSGAPVDWGQAGNTAVAFYSDPESSWDRLTPAVQAKFGDQQAFEDFWDEQDVNDIRGAEAYKRQNNADGSVDIRIGVDFGNGLQQMYLRVIDNGGGLVIDSDPRPGHNSQS
ncbi:serine/threonine-protein kinase [Prauserella cavernicola]|uniref:non-specific serine/threonine protein kinase n=1 Tax=Prauserella cavernicola TaxID=2800127 RepID=A0A934R0Q5_9PSEU|nr:serine/threonine-protein kinase [Prauserella cavernicola]MBK1788774.1 serine/threonine protein kinase [Prauserella cavernicola]